MGEYLWPLTLYGYATSQAGISPPFSVDQKNSGVLVLASLYDEAMLLSFVSECDRDTEVKLTLRQSKAQLKIAVPAQRATMVFVDPASGRVLGQN